MEGPIFYKTILLSAALVLLSYLCVSKSPAWDLAQCPGPSGTYEDLARKKNPGLQECRNQCIQAETKALNLNLENVYANGIPSVETLSNLARSYFALGQLDKTDARIQYFEKGRYFAELLNRLYPRRVEGHYWLALNMCGLCDSNGRGSALLKLPKIVGHLEEALSIDQAYDQAGPLRTLGQIRFEAPNWPLSEGDSIEAVKLLRKAAEIAPDNSTNHLCLGEALLENGDRKEACRELEKAILSKQHSVSPCCLEEDRADALRLMERCRN